MENTTRIYEPGQRVTLLDYLGSVAVPEAAVAESARFKIDTTVWTYVRFTDAGETRTEFWQTDRVRPRR